MSPTGDISSLAAERLGSNKPPKCWVSWRDPLNSQAFYFVTKDSMCLYIMSFVPGSQISVQLKVNWIYLIEIGTFEKSHMHLPPYL